MEQGNITVDLEKDVIIRDDIPTVDVNPNATHVIVISSFVEGFGQVSRIFESICGTEDAARIKSHEARKALSGHFPYSTKIEKIALGQLLSDKEKQYPL